jgi:hypothetical protein
MMNLVFQKLQEMLETQVELPLMLFILTEVPIQENILPKAITNKLEVEQVQQGNMYMMQRI